MIQSFFFGLVPAYAHIQLCEHTHIEESGGRGGRERSVGKGRREAKSIERTQGAFLRK